MKLCMVRAGVLVLVALSLAIVLAPLACGQEAAPPREVRIDTFDRLSRRTGYIVVNPRTGRVDTYDTKSRHTGMGRLSPAPLTRPGQPTVLTPGSVRR